MIKKIKILIKLQKKIGIENKVKIYQIIMMNCKMKSHLYVHNKWQLCE